MAEAKKEVKVKKVATKVAKPVKEEPAVAEVKAVKPTAKAGKRAPKAVKEAEVVAAKKERKVAAKEVKTEEKPKVAPMPRTRIERASKKYRELVKLIDTTKSYSVKDALDLATKTSTTKFDATVELHINLGVDPTQAEQNIRGTVELPAGTGKTLRIAVVAEDDGVTKAKAAGADIAGNDAILADLDKELVNFDVLIATPSMMPKLGKYAKLLGPRGLMPNPKSGTVTADVAGAVKAAKAGRVEYKVDQAGIIHLGIGKVSFGADKLTTNADAVISSVRAAKPATIKGIYVKSIYVSSTMGPSIRVEN